MTLKDQTRDHNVLRAQYPENIDTVQGSHASWKVLDFFSCKFQDLESPGKALWSWQVLEKYPENYAFFIGSNGKQAEIVNVPVCVDFYLLK